LIIAIPLSSFYLNGGGGDDDAAVGKNLGFSVREIDGEEGDGQRERKNKVQHVMCVQGRREKVGGNKGRNSGQPINATCCHMGKVQLSVIFRLEQPVTNNWTGHSNNTH
jgi:hypothetical protein